jgi:ribonuclease Y
VELEHSAEKHRERLESVANMTTQEAKEALVAQIVNEAKREAMATVRDLEQQAREEGEERARKIVTIAIQRVASDQTSESTVSVFHLPSDDMKGRIIGREGRNIRAFEAHTGVNLIIDDTPEAVVLSCFDPVRRETARLALEKLVGDGRIHPARIEEMVERSKREIDEQIKRAGEEACWRSASPTSIRTSSRSSDGSSTGRRTAERPQTPGGGRAPRFRDRVGARPGCARSRARRAPARHREGVTHEVEAPTR